jgi:hypothetical protein
MSLESPPDSRQVSRRRALGIVAVIALVAAALLVGIWGWRTVATNRAAADVAARHRSAQQRATRTLASREASTLRTVGALRGDLIRLTAERDTLAASLYALAGQLAEARARLGDEASGLDSLETRVGTLQTCLGGMEGALNALAVGDTNTALTRLRAVGSACEAAR